MHYIAETKKQELAETLAKAKYFSLIDGGTDSGNNQNELLMVVHCDVSAEDEKVHTVFSGNYAIISCCQWSL